MKLIALSSIVGILLFGVLLDTSFGELSKAVEKEKKEVTNKKIIESYFQDVLSNKELESVEKYFDSNVIGHSPKTNGIGEVKDFFRAFLVDAKAKLLRIAADGDFVWLHLEAKAKVLTDSIRGNPESVTVVDIYKLVNGKITDYWVIMEPVFSSADKDRIEF